MLLRVVDRVATCDPCLFMEKGVRVARDHEAWVKTMSRRDDGAGWIQTHVSSENRKEKMAKGWPT